MNRTEIEDVAAWARRALRKPEPGKPEPTKAERRATWLTERKAERAVDQTSTAQTRSAVEATRRDLHISGSSFTVGAERYAADGSRWKRVA
jgi:hypothetical protein